MPLSEKEKLEIGEADSGSRASRLEEITVRVCLILLFLLWFSAFFPEKRLWGINHWAYFPFWLRTIVIGIACLSFVPAVRRKLSSFLSPPVVRIFGFLTERKKLLGYLLLPLFSLVIFHLLRTKTHLLGDGFQILDGLKSGSLTPNWSQPLAIRIYLNSYHLLNHLFNLDGASVYALISYLAGMLFVVFAIRMALLLGKNTSTRLFVFLILILMGTAELFFGYAEHYPLLCAGILIYIFYCLKYLQMETSFLVPLITLLILIPLHFSSLFLIPSLLFLFLWRDEKKSLTRLVKEKITWILLLGLLILFGGLVFYLRKYNWFVLGYLMPVFHGGYTGSHYTLFSPDHIIDFLNQQLLISPIGFALCLILLILRPKNLNVKNRFLQFLLIVALAQLLFNFIINPGLGAPRDWDLFASAGLGYTVLALFLFAQLSPDSRLSHLKPNLVIVAFLFFLPWILINASPDRSVARFKNVLDLDPKKSRNGHFILAGYFDRAGKPEETIKENKKIMEIFPELDLYQQGMMLLAKNDADQAYQYFTRSLQIAPDFAEAHAGLGWYYLTRGDLKKSESEYQKTLQLKPDYPIAYSDLGDVYMKESKFKDAEKMYRRALKLKVDDPRLYNNLGILYVQLGDLNKAALFYLKAISVKKNFVESYYGLAFIYVQQGKYQEALSQIDRLLEINPNFALGYYLRGSAFEKIGRNQEAADAYRRYLMMHPDDPEAAKIKDSIEKLSRSE
jgi:tetratricopeptide (TPR) repeat protein